MLNKRNAILAVAAALALSLAGCGIGGNSGKSGQSGQSGDAPSAAAIDEVTDEQLQGTTITLARFFGDCNETTDGVTDMSKATTECEAIQILTNQFVAENQWGIKVERLGGATWHSYYDGLNAAMASNDRPDLAVMHGTNLPEYADRGLLVPVPAGIGIDLADATKPARDAVMFDEVDFGVPFDTHAIVSHLNIDLLKQAGLTNADGTYTMPTNTTEFMEHAKKFKEATGKIFLDVALSNDPMGSRLWMALVTQQGGSLYDPATGKFAMDTPEAKKALEFINELVKNGYTEVTHDYDASQQAFLRGESAIMYNGVWAVNQYDAEAPFEYQVTDAPMLFDAPATWANSHVWAIPVQNSADPVKYRAAFEFAKFLYENTGNWAVATGHMASNQAALDSEEYLKAPHRQQYLETAKEYGTMPPRMVQWPKIGDTIQEKIEMTWLNNVPIDDALAELQKATQDTQR